MFLTLSGSGCDAGVGSRGAEKNGNESHWFPETSTPGSAMGLAPGVFLYPSMGVPSGASWYVRAVVVWEVKMRKNTRTPLAAATVLFSLTRATAKLYTFRPLLVVGRELSVDPAWSIV